MSRIHVKSNVYVMYECDSLTTDPICLGQTHHGVNYGLTIPLQESSISVPLQESSISVPLQESSISVPLQEGSTDSNHPNCVPIQESGIDLQCGEYNAHHL